GLWLRGGGAPGAGGWRGDLPQSGASPVNENVGGGQLVFAAVAGAAVMAALIVAYRRYKVAESIAALERVNAQLEQIQVYDEQFTAAAAQIDDEKAASGWPGCVRWQGSPITGLSIGRPVSTCSARTCGCPIHRTVTRALRRRIR